MQKKLSILTVFGLALVFGCSLLSFMKSTAPKSIGLHTPPRSLVADRMEKISLQSLMTMGAIPRIERESILNTTTTTTLAPTTLPPRETISLEEAKLSGVWYKWDGCIGRPGYNGKPVQSPPWLAYALDYSGWPRATWDKICRVIGCESGFNPTAKGGLQGRMHFLLQADIKSWYSGGRWHLRWAPELDATTEEMYNDPVRQLTWFRSLFEYINNSRGTREVWYGDQWTCNRA